MTNPFDAFNKAKKDKDRLERIGSVIEGVNLMFTIKHWIVINPRQILAERDKYDEWWLHDDERH